MSQQPETRSNRKAAVLARLRELKDAKDISDGLFRDKATRDSLRESLLRKCPPCCPPCPELTCPTVPDECVKRHRALPAIASADFLLCHYDAANLDSLVMPPGTPATQPDQNVAVWKNGVDPSKSPLVGLQEAASRLVVHRGLPGVFSESRQCFHCPATVSLTSGTIALVFQLDVSLASTPQNPTPMGTILGWRQDDDANGTLMLRRWGSRIYHMFCVGTTWQYPAWYDSNGILVHVVVFQYTLDVAAGVILFTHVSPQTAPAVQTIRFGGLSGSVMVASGSSIKKSNDSVCNPPDNPAIGIPNASAAQTIVPTNTTLPITVNAYLNGYPTTPVVVQPMNDLVLHELRVYKQTMSDAELLALHTELTQRWHPVAPRGWRMPLNPCAGGVGRIRGRYLRLEMTRGKITMVVEALQGFFGASLSALCLRNTDPCTRSSYLRVA